MTLSYSFMGFLKKFHLKKKIGTINKIRDYSLNHFSILWTYEYIFFFTKLQLREGLGLLHRLWRFRNSRFFCGGGLFAPLQTPNLEDQRLHFVWNLPVDLSGMDGPTRSSRSRQHNPPDRRGAKNSSPQ
jgi:hypothetical protein